MKLVLIPEFKRAHTFLVVQAAGVMGAIAGLSPVIAMAWTNMPHELRDLLPVHVSQALSYAALFTGLVAARVVTTQASADRAAEKTKQAVLAEHAETQAVTTQEPTV